MIAKANLRRFHCSLQLAKDPANTKPHQYVSYRVDPEDALMDAMLSVGGNSETQFRLLEMTEEIRNNEFIIIYSNITRKFADGVVDERVKEPWEIALEKKAKETDLIAEDDYYMSRYRDKYTHGGIDYDDTPKQKRLALVPKEQPTIVEELPKAKEDLYYLPQNYEVAEG